MESLNQKTQEEVTEIIKYLLAPISGEVVSFGNPYKITHTSKIGDEPERSWVEICFPVSITTKFGEDRLLLSSVHMDKLKDAVATACHFLTMYENTISEEGKQEVLKRLYSQEFLEFGKNKK